MFYDLSWILELIRHSKRRGFKPRQRGWRFQTSPAGWKFLTEIRRNTQAKHTSPAGVEVSNGNPQKYAETPYQKPQAIRRNTQAKTPQAKHTSPAGVEVFVSIEDVYLFVDCTIVTIAGGLGISLTHLLLLSAKCSHAIPKVRFVSKGATCLGGAGVRGVNVF